MKLPQINIKNKRASFDYELLDTFHAGIVLSGTEIKSIRLGKAGLTSISMVLITIILLGETESFY